MSCMAFLFVFIAHEVGVPVPSFFLTLWLKARILLFMTLTSKSSRFIGGNRDELLLCPIRALRKYLSQKKPHYPGIEGSFISMSRRKKWVSRNTISFWLCSVITLTHASALEEDCRYLRVRAHEIRKVVTSLLSKKNCTVHQILKAGTRSAQSAFSSFYLRDVTHRHLEMFSIASVRLSRSCNPLTLLSPV